MKYSSMPPSETGHRGRVLVVEDETEIREFIRRYLEDDGFEVLTASSGHQALDLVHQQVELLVLDLGIPGPDGLDIIRRLREFSPIPILIVSARGEGADRVTGLELGADDYLTKPFLPRELVARVKALLRRSRLPSLGSQASGPLVVDPNARRVLLEGEPVDLTPREYDLLKTLALAPGKNFTREELLDRVWGPEYLGDARRVDLYISKIRAKLSRPGKPAPIRSIWGVGYRFES